MPDAVSFGSLGSSIESSEIVDDAVTTAKIADGAVTLAKLGVDGVKKRVYQDETDHDLGNVSSGTYTTFDIPAADLVGKHIQVATRHKHACSGGGTRNHQFKFAGTTVYTLGGGDSTWDNIIIFDLWKDDTGSQTWQVDITIAGSTTHAVSTFTHDDTNDLTVLFDWASSYTGGSASSSQEWIEVHTL